MGVQAEVNQYESSDSGSSLHSLCAFAVNGEILAFLAYSATFQFGAYWEIRRTFVCNGTLHTRVSI